MNRRGFVVRTLAALAAIIAGRNVLAPALPDDVWCKRCGCSQLPDHISANGMEWHGSDGSVFVRVEGDDRYLRVVPWFGSDPRLSGA